jgi:hypothetical protein
MVEATVLPLNKPVTKPSRRARRTTAVQREPKSRSVREYAYLASAASIGVVAIGATALSLSDLAESIGGVAHIELWKSYALAVALDLNFVSTEAFSLFASAAVARATSYATIATKVITLGMSAVANSWAMSHGAEGTVMQAACVAAGCAVPALIALATYTLGKAVRS